MMDGISSTAEDYLKAIWSATEWDGPPATIKALAERFGTTPATVSDTVKRLAAQGLVEHEPYRAIAITATGERLALNVVRRHRLIEAFLVTSLGYSWAEVHDEAENLEHSVSDLMIDRIDTLLGHPAADPHGDPIPAKDGTIAYAAGAIRLSDAGPGIYRVVRISDADADRLTWFLGHGIVPGALITVGSGSARTDSPTVRLPDDSEVAPTASDRDAVMVVAASRRQP
jgi:DtxR family Mn-dependent transcriptional regulator